MSPNMAPVNSLLLQNKQSGQGRLVIDPITRIEGHLRIEVEVRDGQVVEAWSTGTLFRGVETILKGRNPEDAWVFTQRLCGVCTYVHGSTSVRAVEDALGLLIPANARIIRNLMMGAQYLHDHLVHFYHLHALDWVDVVSALSADPAQTAALAQSISPDAPAVDYAQVKTRLQTMVDSGQLGVFTGGFWGHGAYLLSPEENLLLAAHYLAALRQQVDTARMHAIFGGKNPHPQSLMVGGVTCRNELNSSSIAEFRALLAQTRSFIQTMYLPDLALVARKYTDWASYGGSRNFLACGEFPQSASEPSSLFFPQGVITNRGNVTDFDQAEVVEHVARSWYDDQSAGHPWEGETLPAYTGLSTGDRYSWLKAPRYQNQAREVGPLARMLVAYGRGVPEAVSTVNSFLSANGLDASVLYSTLGRTAARGLETIIIAQEMEDWLDDLEGNIGSGNFTTRIPWNMVSSANGVGFNEAPRGALGHWIHIQGGKIANYQMVVPSTWNLGPRCENDLPGPVEEALVGTPVADTSRPLEVIRTVHSFDPCLACAVHVFDPRKQRQSLVRVA